MKTKSAARGKPISSVELTNVSAVGFWLLLDGRELYLPFDQFPWFRHATIAQLAAVERPLPHHLWWPELDIDLDVASIEAPEKFPLVATDAKLPDTANQQKSDADTQVTEQLTHRPRESSGVSRRK